MERIVIKLNSMYISTNREILDKEGISTEGISIPAEGLKITVKGDICREGEEILKGQLEGNKISSSSSSSDVNGKEEEIDLMKYFIREGIEEVREKEENAMSGTGVKNPYEMQDTVEFGDSPRILGEKPPMDLKYSLNPFPFPGNNSLNPTSHISSPSNSTSNIHFYTQIIHLAFCGKNIKPLLIHSSSNHKVFLIIHIDHPDDVYSLQQIIYTTEEELNFIRNFHIPRLSQHNLDPSFDTSMVNLVSYFEVVSKYVFQLCTQNPLDIYAARILSNLKLENSPEEFKEKDISPEMPTKELNEIRREEENEVPGENVNEVRGETVNDIGGVEQKNIIIEEERKSGFSLQAGGNRVEGGREKGDTELMKLETNILIGEDIVTIEDPELRGRSHIYLIYKKYKMLPIAVKQYKLKSKDELEELEANALLDKTRLVTFYPNFPPDAYYNVYYREPYAEVRVPYHGQHLQRDMMLSDPSLILDWVKASIAHLSLESKHSIHHCNLKPNNILVNDGNYLEITDYRIHLIDRNIPATHFRDLYLHLFQGETRIYAAPELFKIPPYFDILTAQNLLSSDIFSLALVFIYVLMGIHENEGRLKELTLLKETNFEGFHQEVAHEFNLLFGEDLEMERLAAILLAMIQDAHKRPQGILVYDYIHQHKYNNRLPSHISADLTHPTNSSLYLQ